ncbi:hypothetical protein [Pseudomonas sp. MUP55]|uniref:hypothetical protein n=1 Tax=Pseudomonas sp. MUP55 TaxID=3087234 RepID=UPI002A59EF78|nr:MULTISPECIES: hypothetical protein [unclassified Pseudomonas]WPN93865.1 hypothetical protein SC319_05715 [Pseudomonas sp. MUP56]WPN99391.1 hypothetical protein SC318_05715 [Pseudomonas sp. MUP55]
MNTRTTGTSWRAALLAVPLCLATHFASAAVQDITAQFRPDPTNPMVNKFTNTTPQSGVCPGHMPARCEALGIFSIRTTDITFASVGPIEPYHADPRQGLTFKVPSEWRSFEVVSAQGDREIVEMRISGVGSRFNTTNPPGVHIWSPLPANWTHPPAPCQYTGMWAAGNTLRLWFWIVPEGAGACSMPTPERVPTSNFSMLEYAYELRTPNPLGMRTGQYTGSISYSIGPYKDFDFGDIYMPNDEVLTFNFSLTVEHVLKVDLPPGGSRIELLPEGGWQAWLNQGRRPARLFRDQTFTLSASSRFKMNLECGLVIGNTCGLRNDAGDQVPVQIAVSLPYGVRDQYDQPVNKLPLRLDGVGTELLQPVYYLDNRPAKLHFEVGRDDVGEMLKTPGTTYTGTATVIWDSEV